MEHCCCCGSTDVPSLPLLPRRLGGFRGPGRGARGSWGMRESGGGYWANPRSEPQDLRLLGGELLLGDDALVPEDGKLLELVDVRALGGFRCGGFIRWSRGSGRRGLGGRGAPLRGLGSHVGCGPGHDRGGRDSGHGCTSSQWHVYRLLLSWRRRRGRSARMVWACRSQSRVSARALTACSMISRGIRAPSRMTPLASRTASANGPAQVSSQMSSAAEVFGSRLRAAWATSSSARIPPTSAFPSASFMMKVRSMILTSPPSMSLASSGTI